MTLILGLILGMAIGRQTGVYSQRKARKVHARKTAAAGTMLRR